MNAEEKRNYTYSVIYRLSVLILPLIVTPYVARVLGAEQVGLYAFSSTVACYFIMLAKLGLDNYGNWSIASCRDDLEKRSRVFWGIFILQLITSVLSILIFALLILTAFRENRMIYWLQLLYVGSALFDVSWFFYGMEKFKIVTIRSVIARLLIIAGVFIFVHSESDLWIYTGIMSACFLFEQLQLIPFLLHQVKRVTLRREDIAGHILPNIKLFIPLLALSMYHWMDRMMLGVMAGSTAIVAFYTYAEYMINLPKGILSALDAVMLPRISGLVAREQAEEGLQKMRNSLRFNSFVSCALCFGIAGVSTVFMPWFLGPGFSPTILLTMELAIVMIPMSINSVVQTQYLIPFKKEKVFIQSVTLGAAAKFVLNLILIPVYGASGAVIGTLIVELAVCAYQMYRIRSIYSFGQLVKVLLPFLLCGSAEFAVTYALSGLPINPPLLLLIQVCAGGAVYLAGCSLYLILIRKEYLSLKDMIQTLRQ